MKLGVVDVGGGLRGIYAAGAFDYCLDALERFYQKGRQDGQAILNFIRSDGTKREWLSVC